MKFYLSTQHVVYGHVARLRGEWQCHCAVVGVGSDVELFYGENMTKISPFTNVSFLRVATILCIIPQCLGALSDKQLCCDPNCSVPISLAKTTLAYQANDPEVMSFNVNVNVKVFSKGAGKRTDLWGVEINGKRGFAPKTFLNEYKVLKCSLSHEVPVYKFNDKTSNVQSEKLESTEEQEESNELHNLLDDKLSKDEKTPSLKSIESIIEESPGISADSVSPSYEVIDGTTVYFETDSSVQPSSVAEAAQATALSNKLGSIVDPDSKMDREGQSSNKDTFIDNKDLHSGMDNTSKLEEIKLQVDTQKQTSSKLETNVPLENPEVIITSTLDSENKDDTLMLDDSSEQSEELLKDVEHMEKSDNVKSNEKEKVTESDGILATITNTFKNVLSSSMETVATESISAQSGDDTAAPEVVVESELQIEKKVSENIGTETAATEDILPLIQVKDSNIDQSITDNEKVEMQQKIIHESVKSVEISDGKIKEAFTIISESNISLSDVPSSNNFIHEDADKPAKELPTASSILANDSSAAANADVTIHIENIQTQETSEADKVTENTKVDSAVTSDKEESAILFNLQETIVTKVTTQKNEQKLLENDEAHLEFAKKNADHKEAVDQADKIIITEIPETTTLPSETENITAESFFESHSVDKSTAVMQEALNDSIANIQFNKESIVHSNVNKNDDLVNDASADNVPIESNEFLNDVKSSVLGSEQSIDSSQESMISEQTMTSNEFLKKQILSSTENLEQKNIESQIVKSVKEEETLPEYDGHISSENKVLYENQDEDNSLEKVETTSIPSGVEDVCTNDHDCITETTTEFLNQKGDFESEEDNVIDWTRLDHNYWKTLIYLCVTAFTTLMFTLGYYYIENIRRDEQLIARINKLEKELLVSTKECEVLSENLKSTKDKLHCIEDESFGSNEMVVSLKADLKMSQKIKIELEEQVTMLEKDLENATEAGLELERMLREVLSSNNEVNPLAQSVEDLQARLDAQQAANESLTNALNLKTQEIETLSTELASTKKKYEELEVDFLREQDELTTQKNLKNNIEQTLTDKIHSLEQQVNELSTVKSSLHKELKSKEIEVKELLEIINQIKSNNLDLEKLYDVSRIKIEAVQLREERDELKMRLNDVNGAHQLLEEHMKLVKEEIVALSDQCKIAEKEKKDAETRLEVLSKFFQEKEAERKKEETIWLQNQGEVVSTVERLHTMQNEIQNYKQQIEMLKREIVDQEREYKNQISALETKAHEQWVAARQNERRLEESKAQASQLRNRLTLVEKNLNDADPEAKLHRLEANGETATSLPLFIGPESSNSPVMFSGSGVPPVPPPSYLHFPPYLPPLPPAAASSLPPYDISQRPPPLGGRLSSPPPMLPPPALHRPPVSGGRYENAGSPPPPMSPPHLLPPFDHHRSPPLPPFGGDHIPSLPLPGSILPPPPGTIPWGEESLPHTRNSGFHPQREQRARNHKGSLHSSGESLDKAHGKV
ncbi:transport and Golgi organization protein 1 isoform X2 [Monomorium pharaonis]|uniref:transport and Golgi organization protein 1 isoform X2 n=1 Tax=Monomorium pharaonis TaxID=307658 RepID=UPI00102E1B81|nr:transport and Golgi organization protein 1 isoform X2 [Monomorium pharaonis]